LVLVSPTAGLNIGSDSDLSIELANPGGKKAGVRMGHPLFDE
jgi:hypothetical protein